MYRYRASTDYLQLYGTGTVFEYHPVHVYCYVLDLDLSIVLVPVQE